MKCLRKVLMLILLFSSIRTNLYAGEGLKLWQRTEELRISTEIEKNKRPSVFLPNKKARKEANKRLNEAITKASNELSSRGIEASNDAGVIFLSAEELLGQQMESKEPEKTKTESEQVTNPKSMEMISSDVKAVFSPNIKVDSAITK